MNEFHLEKWEKLPGEQDGAWPSFEIEVGPPSRSRTVAFCTVPYLGEPGVVFFRDEGVTYLVVELSSEGHPCFLEGVQENEAENAVRFALEGERLKKARPFFFADEPGLALVTETAIHWWHPRAPKSFFRLPRFALKDREYSGGAMYEFLVNARQDPGSEAFFSLGWRQKSDDEQLAVVIELCPQLAELHQVMTWCLECALDLFSECDRANWIMLGSSDYAFGGWWGKTARFYDPSSKIPLLGEWNHLLASHFLPFPALDKSSPVCLLERYDFYTNLAQVTVESTTRHERLEAHQHLREWMKKNVPERMDLLQV